MRRLAIVITTFALTMSGLAFVPAQAKAKVTKPSAPAISAISSSAPKKGKVNVTVTITLPTSNGGSKITGSKVTAGGKSCTIKKTKTSCTIKSIKNGKALKISAKSKNKKGFSPKSARVTYTAGASAWPTTPVANVISDTPAASAPVAGPAPLTCATGGTCVVGNTGPGGGFVYYVDSTGFSCGEDYTTSGSPTGGLCRYLEVAPSGWNNTANDPALLWAVTSKQNVDVYGIANDSAAYNNALGIGLGYKNSRLIVAQGNDTTTAAGAARAYGGGSKNDWYLPSAAELNLLFQWNVGIAPSVTTECVGGSLNSATYGAQTSGLSGNNYWSSSEYSSTHAWGGGCFQAIGNKDGFYPSLAVEVRPVRAF
jgi:hypothetical protein